MNDLYKYNEIYNEIFPLYQNDLKIIHNYNFLCSSFGNLEITQRNIIKLLNCEYVIFPTNQFYHWSSSSLKYLDKNKIVCLNYYLKDVILNKINDINNIIKSNDPKYDKLKNMIKTNLKLENLKSIYFLENMIEPNTLYRKIKFSIEETFLSFSTYSFKRIEYKLKTICQLLEKMGALNIDITYFDDNTTQQTIEGNINAGVGESGGKMSNTDNSKKRFEIHRLYDKKNQMNNLDLNIHELYKSIYNEKDFFIDKNQFLSDIDLKFLINSRCLNIIKKYDTILEFEYINSFEKKIIEKAYNFGFHFDISTHKEKKESLHLTVDFLDPYEDYQSINGYNITPNSEGFMHLEKIINIINDKNNGKNDISHYLKIHNFLESYMKQNNENKKTLNIIFNKNIDLVKTYDHILNYNFSPHEIELLFYHYFQNNITFRSFERFRNIFLKPIDNFNDILLKNNYFNIKVDEDDYRNNFYENILCRSSEPHKFKEFDKLIFTSHQYHIIFEFVLKIIKIFDNALEKLKQNIIIKINDLKIFLNNSKDEYKSLFNLLNNIINKKRQFSTPKSYNKLVNQIKNNPKYNFYYPYHKHTSTKISYKKKIKSLLYNSQNNYLVEHKNYPSDKQIYTENLLKRYNQLYPENYKIKDSFFTLISKINYNNTPLNNDINIILFLKNIIKDELNILLNKIRLIIIKDFTELDIDNIQYINECSQPSFLDIRHNFLLRELLNDIEDDDNDDNDDKQSIDTENFNEQYNKKYKDEKDIILFMLAILFDYNNDETPLDEYNNEDFINKYFKKIENNLINSFDTIKNELHNIINQFFYDKNGFFGLKNFDLNHIKYYLLKNYKLNKVSDIDKTTLIVFVALFHSDYINFGEFNNGNKSFLDIMHNFYITIIQNYDKFKHNDIDKLNMINIKETYCINNILRNYQKYKIFFTFDDFKKDFRFIFSDEVVQNKYLSCNIHENAYVNPDVDVDIDQNQYPLSDDENQFIPLVEENYNIPNKKKLKNKKKHKNIK